MWPGMQVVITGSTKGLGLALAREFLQLGDSVVISSRSADHCRQAHQQLLQDKPKGTVLAEPCDVTQPEEVQRLAQQACDQLGSIDIWVNNAGQSQSPRTALTATPASTVQQIVGTNLVGALLGSQAAMAVMQQQDTGGKIFLVDGAGSTGRATSNSASYGASKAAMPQLAKSLAAEARRSKVSVHICSPGMVATDLLLQGVSSPRAAQIVNILAEDAHVVAAWLCPRMRGVTGQGKYFRWETDS
eukprot:jgi/Astpho2/745/e_gw1.00016.173.1_t